MLLLIFVSSLLLTVHGVNDGSSSKECTENMACKVSTIREPTERIYDDEETTQAYNKNFNGFRPGIQPVQVADHYTEWAKEGTYETYLSPERYLGPFVAAETIAQYLGDNKQARIIDVAAGTGILGKQLRTRGFTNIDALDPSEGMLEVARSQKLYERYINSFMDENRLDIEDDTYDCMGIAGGMGEGHIPCAALSEMVRIVKPGGCIINVFREEYIYYVDEYKDRLEPAMKELEKQGRWKMMQRKVLEEYAFDTTGIMFVFKVL